MEINFLQWESKRDLKITGLCTSRHYESAVLFWENDLAIYLNESFIPWLGGIWIYNWKAMNRQSMHIFVNTQVAARYLEISLTILHDVTGCKEGNKYVIAMQLWTIEICSQHSAYWCPKTVRCGNGRVTIMLVSQVPLHYQDPFWSAYGFRLTPWGWKRMAAISQMTYSNAFSWMKMYKFCLRFHWSLFLRFELTIFQHWFRKWSGAD